MLVAPLSATETPVVDEIARLGRVELDATRELQKPWARFWVARNQPNSAPVGFLLAWAVADELHVIDLVTHPEMRRRGVAKALIGALVAHARHARARLILLEVRQSNRAAIQLYRSHGFSAIGIRRGYYANGAEDAIEMVLALDPETGHIQPGRDEVRLPEIRD